MGYIKKIIWGIVILVALLFIVMMVVPGAAFVIGAYTHRIVTFLTFGKV